ncbi:hypothetical protein F4776DRAFT_659492 [Hypoxylon sp. NC0597]|nr:hypothetical protein F4776DRAFT_659492 [Hypoxylon sp. NC0597]
MATVPSSWVDEAFKSAKEDFKRSLKNPALYDFSTISSVDDVLDEARKIERQQAKTKTLRGLKRVQPLIDGLKEYSGIIEVFVQAKPDVMSLIWGPLKFILQASSSVISAFERVVKVIMDLGMTLPSFKAYTQLFESNPDIRRALCLFYADILDFYAILLNFLASRGPNLLLEPLWPNIRSRIAKVQENMEHHKAMMMTNVTLESILQAHQARRLMLEEHDRAQAFRDSQTFGVVRNELEPHNHDAELDKIIRRSSVVSGRWLDNESDFMRWLDTADRTTRCIWLHGIPGSGKTFLVGNLIKRMQDSGQRVLFALLSHDNQAAGDTVKVFHSLLFQLLESDPTLRPILHDSFQSDYRKLKNDTDFVLDLLCRILNGLSPSFIILDGLDELDEPSWKHLLSRILEISKRCPETKLLISSREERDISLQLNSKAVPLRVDHKNSQDIDSFIQLECEDLLLEMKSYGADEPTCLKVKEKLHTIAENAAGKLVLLMVKDRGTLHDIDEQMEDLPDGLDEVYGRLLVRIKVKSTRTIQAVVRTILQWVACAQRPLREEEMLQILAVQPGQLDFTKGRKVFRDIRKLCGPIIEINEGNIRFVHFSAKEYLLHEQSNSFLKLPDAHLDATQVCVTYLSFSSLNTLFSLSQDEIPEVQKRILDGDYVMFEYASMYFLEHLKAFLESQNGELDIRLVKTLTRFQEIRSDDSIDTSLVSNRFIHMFKAFADIPHLQNCLSTAARSQTRAQLGLYEQDELMNSSINDPLKIFSARRRFRQHLEDMMCQEPNHGVGCHCDDLTRLYGTMLYHCDQRFCYAYRSGFESGRSRNQHLRIHQRPHKCSIANCLFGELGFHDTVELQRHMCLAHPQQTFADDESDLLAAPAPNFNMDEIEIGIKSAMIRDAIKLGELEPVRKLIHDTRFQYWDISSFLQLACSRPSQDIFPSLYNEIIQQYKEQASRDLEMFLAIALEVENRPCIKFLLSRGADMLEDKGLPRADVRSQIPQRRRIMNERFSGYVRALSLWSPDLMHYLIEECHVDIPASMMVPGDIFYSPAIWKATLDEARMRFNGIKQYIIWPEAYSQGVVQAARVGCLLSARICLENGGDPNGVHIHDPNEMGSLHRSALYSAVKSGSQNGAEMVKLLLQFGADLEHTQAKKAEKLVGMKKIEKYFGFTWGEIVHRIRAGEDLAITNDHIRK